ncbi:hypothetical protein [Sporosarcina sp. HYO08]|nr:hypothetical protein [Sporosarcina sp. HYO08]
MWIITLYAEKAIKMFEYETEQEAKIAFQKVKGNKILSLVN